MVFGRRLLLVVTLIIIMVLSFCILRQWSIHRIRSSQKFYKHGEEVLGISMHGRRSSDLLLTPHNEHLNNVDSDDFIHIVQTIQGESAAYRAITMIKSLLYYQGRCRTDRPACCLQMKSNTGCHINIIKRSQEATPIHLHLVRDTVASLILDVLYRSWESESFVYSLYNLDTCMRLVDWITTTHWTGPTALCKLFLNSILPQTVEKVIVVDTNGLWNYDIFDLWRHFDNFNENQLFALAWEQQSPEPDCKHLTYKPIPPHGLNDDVVLLHLQRMRTKGWDEMRSVALSTILGERGHLGKGGQDIFNTVVNWFPQIYYQLPCEWNTQLHSKMVVSCCPTVWPDRLPNEVDCITLSSPGTLKKPSLIRLASLNLIVKQEDPNWNGTLTNSSQTGKMVTRFTEVYSRFRAIPMDCLI